MNQRKITRGSHFLPKNAYLKQFTCPNYETQIFQYNRDKDPFQTNIENTGKKRDLYNFTNENGEKDDSFEKLLQKIEDQVAPIIRELSKIPSPICLNLEDKESLTLFMAFQHIRTPAFRKSQKDMSLDLKKRIIQMIALDPDVFLNQTKKIMPDRFIEPDFDIEKIRNFILEEDNYTLVMENDHDYFLGHSMKLGPELARIIFGKRILLLSVEDESLLITSDHPVIVMPYDIQGRPNERGGFIMSDIGVPISPKKFLLFYNDSNPTINQFNSKQQEFIQDKKISKKNVDTLNDYQIQHAENFLFASHSDLRLAEKFKSTKKIKRFNVL